MKEGWEYKSLGKVCRIFNGNSINADYKKTHYMGLSEGYPFIATKDVSFDGIIDYENGVKIPFDEGLKVAKPNSVFICVEGGSAGRKIGLVNREVCFGNKLFCLDSQGSVLGPFIYYYLKSELFQDQFAERLTGLIGGVSAKKFNDISIIYPSLSEQQSIVDYLDSAFAKIDAMKANAEKALNEAKALFQASLKEMLEPKEGWEEKILPEISENLDSIRKPVTKGKRTAGIYPYYGASGIVDYVDDYLFDEDLLCISEDGANLLMRTYPIAFPISGKVWVNNHAHVLRFKNIVTQKYVEYYFSGMKLDEYITGAAQPKLTQKALNSIIINLPSTLDAQQSIVTTLDSLKSKVDRLQANFEKISQECDALKQAILRQVFE